MINMIDICKSYPNGVMALEDVNVTIEKGEFVFLVGQSGAGKSTFMKLLLKEEQATSGKLYLDGQDITHMHRRRIPLLRRKMGVVFQDFRLLPNKTVYENVAFAMEILGAKSRDIRRQVPMVLGLVSLSDKAKHYPNQLSGGEQQRVSIARAMINNPPLLIADEPTGNLDPDTSWEIMKLLRQINRRGTTVVMATHDKEIVDNMRRRVIALDKGSVTRDIDRGGYVHED